MTDNKANERRDEYGDERNGAQHDELVVALRDSLDLLDRVVSAAAPGARALEQQLAARRKVLRQRLLRDLAAFVAVAVALLAGALSLYARVPFALVAVQALAVTIVPYALLRLRRKRGNEG